MNKTIYQRYNLYIDCIPTDYSLKISDDTLKKIEYIGTRGNNSSFNLIKENKVYSTLINEIKLDYSRQMNKMLFDKEVLLFFPFNLTIILIKRNI